MNIAVVYFTYLAIGVALTVWVARTLHRNGRIFLVDAFHGNEPLADAVNHLLVVGFYLINIGYITVALKTAEGLDNLRAVIEVESYKIGVVILILGFLHVFNVMVFARMRRRAIDGPPASFIPRPGFPPPPSAEGAAHQRS